MKRSNISLSLGVLLAACSVLWMTGATGVTSAVAAPLQHKGDCLSCHSDPDMVGVLPDGTTISLFYDEAGHKESSHTDGCSACHDAQADYPHKGSPSNACVVCHPETAGVEAPTGTAFEISQYADQREMVMEINNACHKCHAEKFHESTDSAHAKVFEQGNRFAPICADCHGGHGITSPHEPRAKIAEICGDCHKAISTTYKTSVHGASLTEEANPDVPVCTDCHGSHVVEGPTHDDFRVTSVALCGSCHSNPGIMDRYNLSTEVLQTYLDDFHGRSVAYSEKYGDEKSAKATCYDCHGVHNIQRPEDEQSAVFPANLQETCRQCHPDANFAFPQAWLGHSSWRDAPVFVFVNKFYAVVLPLSLTALGVYLLPDMIRRLLNGRTNGKKAASQSDAPKEVR